MFEPDLTSFDAANFERIVFSEAARRTLLGPLTTKKLIVVAAVYAAITSLRIFSDSRSNHTVDPLSTINPEECTNVGQTPEEVPPSETGPSTTDRLLSLIDSATNVVELGAIRVALGLSAPESTNTEEVRQSVLNYLSRVDLELRASGAVEEAEQFLRFTLSQVDATLQAIRDI